MRAEVREFVQIAMLDFVEFLEDDFNFPEALARVHGFISDANSVIDEGPLYAAEIDAIVELLKSFDAVLSVMRFELLIPDEAPAEVLALLEERNEAK